MHLDTPNVAADDSREVRVNEVLQAMTLNEKADMLCGDGMWHLRGIERLGLPQIRLTDCGHGIAATGQARTAATCFPTAIGQASTWNPELIERLGAALGREVRATGNAVLLGPMVNIHRTPLNGRSFECFSEDPLLTGKLAAAFIRGVQSQGVGACIKGLTANNQQKDQMELNVVMDERTLREIYLPNFKIPLQEARPLGLMTCYNGLNGQHSSASRHLLREIVKDEWGFQGFIVSDWRGTHSPQVVEAGLDLEMPGPGKFMRQEDILAAVDEGRLTHDDLDDRVRRLLRAIISVMPVVAAGDAYADELDCPEHRAVARQVAEESIILLKNEDRLLPLDCQRLRTIAVIGPSAEQALLGPRGSAAVAPSRSVGPLQGLRDCCDENVQIIYEEGCGLLGEGIVIYPQFLTPTGGRPGASGFAAEYFNNSTLEGPPILSTLQPQIDFAWGTASPGAYVGRHGWSVRWTATLTPPVSGRYQLGAFGHHGGVRLYVDDQLVLDDWGQLADTQLHQQAATPERYGRRVEVELKADHPVALRMEFRKTLHTAAARLEWTVPGWADSVERAAVAAAAADVALVCVGLNCLHEGGTLDRQDLSLPGRQRELIEAVATANPNTIVALFGGGPLEVEPWIGSVRAVLQAWYPGEEGGHALADILLGKVNPSGRLPDTLPRRLEDTPAWGHYPGNGTEVRYEEGIFVGYRHYDAKGIEPSFPFGFGLSYTDFSFSNLALSSPTMAAEDTLQVRVDVTNTGQRAGQEVVQLYLGDLQASLPRPPRELKGFAKVHLEPGRQTTVTFTLTPDDLSFFDPQANIWRAEPGTFEVQIGRHLGHGPSTRFDYAG